MFCKPRFITTALAVALAFAGPACAANAAPVATATPADQGSFVLRWPGGDQASVFAQTTATLPTPDAKPRLADASSPATLTALDPAYRWYFVIAPAYGAPMLTATRQFALQGARNVRDMGGFVTTDGHVTAWGKVFRSDSLGKLTPADERALAAADITTVVSYLGASEIARDGADRLPPTTRLVHLPVLDPFTQALADSLEKALHAGNRTELEAMLGDGKARRIGNDGFVAQLAQPRTMAAYGQTLRLIADGRNALLYHCSSGKDRTGLMSAFLLGILGVPDQTIVADFVASNDYNAAHNAKIYAWLRSKGIDIDLIRPLLEQRASEIQPVLDLVHHRYGGWDTFAQKVLGLDNPTLAKLRAKMLTPTPR